MTSEQFELWSTQISKTELRWSAQDWPALCGDAYPLIKASLREKGRFATWQENQSR